MRALTLTAAFIFGLLAGGPQAFATDSPMTYPQVKGEALLAVFNETKMVGEYRHYRDKTQTFNYTEYHFENGTSDYIEGGRQEDGLWSIVGNDKICYRYPESEYYQRTYCFMVFNDDGCYYKFSQYDMTLRGPRSWDLWTSRAVRKGSGASCAAPIG